MRTLICKFCSQGKTAKEMSDHETYCGSRTERCDRCPDWVQLKEWDSHQNRYHANVHRRFRERSVIAQTETIIEYNAGERKNFVKPKCVKMSKILQYHTFISTLCTFYSLIFQTDKKWFEFQRASLVIFVVFPREFQKARDTLSFLHWKNWVMVERKLLLLNVVSQATKLFTSSFSFFRQVPMTKMSIILRRLLKLCYLVNFVTVWFQ